MKKLLSILPILIVVAACDIRDNKDIVPNEQFVKIYDRNDFSAAVSSLDVEELPDGGFIVLGRRRVDAYDFLGTYLMKADELGEYVSENDLSNDYAHPIGELTYVNGSLFFFAMSPATLETFLLEINTDGVLVNETPIGLTYPQYAAFDNGNFILLSYDHESKESVLSIVGTDGSISQSARFTIGSGDEVEAPIISHFTRTGKPLPFFSGRMNSGMYYFNGYYNFTLSLVFTDLSGGDPNGVLQGQRSQGGVSSALNLTGNSFAVSRFNFGDNYILPQTDIETGGISSSSDLGGFTIPELVGDAPFVLKRITVNQQNYVIYASDTNNKQIVLYAYDETTGELKGTTYLGFSNPFELASFRTTADEGLIVAGTAFVSGRFPRISIYKLSNKDLVDLVSQVQE